MERPFCSVPCSLAQRSVRGFPDLRSLGVKSIEPLTYMANATDLLYIPTYLPTAAYRSASQRPVRPPAYLPTSLLGVQLELRGRTSRPPAVRDLPLPTYLPTYLQYQGIPQRQPSYRKRRTPPHAAARGLHSCTCVSCVTLRGPRGSHRGTGTLPNPLLPYSTALYSNKQGLQKVMNVQNTRNTTRAPRKILRRSDSLKK